ncbi:DUF5710 domain-containing protein [Polaromonas sp.]|uniref:DUF5710 domain-containing protein n=1 Tax=Polaromonas sp. TaxID=1869339 RepID=UPI003529FF99
MSRSVVFGFDDLGFAGGARERVMWDEEFATNAHMLVAGKSGTGKTFTLKRIISQMIRQLPGREPVRVHNFDVHGDMHYPDESRILFSESTHFGINPLRLSSDPHYGGVRKCVQNFIEMMSDSSPRAQLGPRQVTALRNILYELFEIKGFKVNDPMSWVADADSDEAPDDNGRIYLDVPYDDRELAKSAARAEGVTLQFDVDEKCWWCSAYVGGLGRWPTRSRGRKAPTVPEAARFISARLKTMLTGGGTRTIRLLEEHNKKVVVWQAKLRKLQEGGDPAEIEAIQRDIHNGAAAMIDSFTEYVLSIETGRELDTLTRYESSETLKSIGDRLDTLVATGIFKPRDPPFDPRAPIWSYDIAPLRDSEQQFFVWTKLKQILDDAMELGPVNGPSEVRVCVVIDEGHKFFIHKDTNILDKIVKEGRKFGVSLICASQAPSHFSEDFLGNVGTKALLGLDPMYRDGTVRKMRIDPKILDYVVAGKIAAIQVSDKRDMSHQFRKTRVGN